MRNVSEFDANILMLVKKNHRWCVCICEGQGSRPKYNGCGSSAVEMDSYRVEIFIFKMKMRDCL